MSVECRSSTPSLPGCYATGPAIATPTGRPAPRPGTPAGPQGRVKQYETLARSCDVCNHK